MPAHVQLQFNNLNVSLQPSDFIYYVPTTKVGTTTSVQNFSTGAYSNIIRFGQVVSIDRDNGTILVLWDDSDNDLDDSPDIPLPNTEDFILFSKSTPNNTTALVGYYASANFVNDSNEKVELFSVGSEISLSSK
jgi:hypothetical protein